MPLKTGVCVQLCTNEPYCTILLNLFLKTSIYIKGSYSNCPVKVNKVTVRQLLKLKGKVNVSDQASRALLESGSCDTKTNHP